MIDTPTHQALSEILGENVCFEAPLSRHTSLRVGGPAAALATPADRTQLADLIRLCNRRGIAHRVLGAGFNTLVLDGGIDAVVILLANFRAIERLDATHLRAEAGVPHHRLVKFCEQNGLAGLEFVIGIPGSVGGWVAMNAGVGTREMKDVVTSVELMEPSMAQTIEIARRDLQFEYRALRGVPSGSVLLSATFRLDPGDSAAIRKETKRLLAARAEKQPTNQPSCGSVFKNPPGDSAGRLIEEAGLKGARVGGAEISQRHANFIVNCGGAKASDVLELIERARDAVKRNTGIELETEVVIVGRSAPWER